MPENWREVAQRVRNWGKWGDSDQIGTLNYITPREDRNSQPPGQAGTQFPALCALRS